MTFDYTQALPHWINRAAQAIRAEAERRLAAAGHPLSAEDWAVLMVIWQDGPQEMGRLAALTLRDRTTLTRRIDRMVARGLVTRVEDPADRRRVRVAASAEGAALRGPVTQVIGGLVAEMQAGIPAGDLDKARQVIARMIGTLPG